MSEEKTYQFAIQDHKNFDNLLFHYSILDLKANIVTTRSGFYIFIK